MKRRILWCILCACLVSTSLFAQEPALLSRVHGAEACRKWVDGQMEKRTLKQKVGQLFIYTLQPVTNQCS